MDTRKYNNVLRMALIATGTSQMRRFIFAALRQLRCERGLCGHNLEKVIGPENCEAHLAKVRSEARRIHFGTVGWLTTKGSQLCRKGRPITPHLKGQKVGKVLFDLRVICVTSWHILSRGWHVQSQNGRIPRIGLVGEGRSATRSPYRAPGCLKPSFSCS